jgi:DNA-binding transcriptional regulator GbsR (MarR family)
MVWLFGGGRNNKNKKLKEEVEKIDEDIKKLLEEFEKHPYDRDPKRIEEYKKLIEKILKEIEEHKKSLHELYGSKPDNFPELENIEHYLRLYLNTLKAAEKRHDIIIPRSSLEIIADNWHKHRIKFK